MLWKPDQCHSGTINDRQTQKILNIIVNILLQGKTIQTVSNNNSATENVYKKLSSPKYNLELIAATLGN